MAGVQNMVVFPKGGLCRLGVTADTHGLVRPQIPDLFKGVDLIFHAGDVGTRAVLDDLRRIAPVTAVLANMDSQQVGDLNPVEIVLVGSLSIYMLHDRHHLDVDPSGGRFHAVVYGHTHRPEIQWKDRVLYLNPGSAGPRRFNYPISVAVLEISGTALAPRIIELEG